MFSPEASVSSARSSLRNTRRRQRKDSDGPAQQPRRKRSKFNEESFVDPGDALVNGNGSPLMNGHAVQSIENSVVVVDMPVREKKAQPKRASKDDYGLYLTRNANYSVKKLPGFPAALLRPPTPFIGTVLSPVGLALALTHNHAHVWGYSILNESTKVISLPLQFGLKNTDALPLGAVVRNGPANDYGVIAIAPSTGKVRFWENIDSADARSLYPQRGQGVEGLVRLYSGESITDLVDVEHAGYIVVFSSGRLAQLTVRDSQGRPNITTTVLSAPNSSGGSFFSFKGLLGGSARKTIASVRSRPSASKGHMEVVSATRNSMFQIWDLSFSGQHNHVRDVDARPKILTAVQADLTPEVRNQQDVQVLDFAIFREKPGQQHASILVLVARTGREALDYFLMEMDLLHTDVDIRRAIPVRNYHQPQLMKEPAGKLLLPHHGHTAYVQFPRAIFVASLSQPEDDSPEAQLRADTGILNLPFQDTIYFREDLNVQFCGSALEEPTRKDDCATALLFVQGYGLLQIAAQPPTNNENDRERVKVTARSKLEQATFFSTIPGNVIDFSVKARYSFDKLETAEAALHISAKILSSSYDHIEKVTSSVDEQFRKRMSSLKTLIAQLQSNFPEMPDLIKWRLLWHAEKLAAAQKLWNWYQDKLQDEKVHPEAYPEQILMGDIVRALNEKFKTPIQPESGETDRIRYFFLKDVDSIHALIPWGWHYLRTFYIQRDETSKPSLMQRLNEGTDVMLTVLETVFAFRKANMESYGLDPDSLDDGVLKPKGGYDRLPHFWTSSHNIVTSIRSLVDVGRDLAVETFEEGYWEALASKIGRDIPRLVHVGCQTHVERFQWLLAQPDEKSKEKGRTLKQEWDTNVRPNHLLGLGEMGLATEGMKLAEQYLDMPTLVDLIWEESDWLEKEKAQAPTKMEQAESTVKLNRIKERINRYFETYGDAWAAAFYSKYIKSNKAASLFMQEHLHQPALTRFLRAEPSRARLSWINEISGEKNYVQAASNLFHTGADHETNAWCQRVQFSMAKLAMLCKFEKKDDDQEAIILKSQKAHSMSLKRIENQLASTKIQEEVYERLVPVITGALDDETAVELLMQQFGEGQLVERPAHQRILKEGFESLIHHRVMDPLLLIDVLTLIQPCKTQNESSGEMEEYSLLDGEEMFLALQVLMLHWGGIHRTTRDGIRKLVWKRLAIRDDWSFFNNLKGIPDAQLNSLLVRTSAGWAMRGLCKLREEDESPLLVWPKRVEDLIGSGGTHGELAVRFPNEDLREPIIRDNERDDAVLINHMKNNRLSDWFSAALKAGKDAADAERIRRNPDGVPQVSQEIVLHRKDDDEVADAAPETVTSGLIEGEIESVAGEGQGEIEMQDS